MPNKSISQLSSVSTLLDADLFHISTAGVDKKITTANLRTAINGSSSEIIYKAELDITSAQVLALFGTPLLFIAAPATGYYVELLSFSVLTPATIYDTPYDTNMSVSAITDTATKPQYTAENALNATVYRNVRGNLQLGTTATATQLIKNKGVYVQVDTGNPLNGTFDIKVFATYRIVQE